MQANQSSFPGMGVGNSPAIPNSLQLLRTGTFPGFEKLIKDKKNKKETIKL